MGKFALGFVVALAIVAGMYYYMGTEEPQRVETEQEEAPRDTSAEVKTNAIPEGAVMEDGTLPE